MTDNDLYKDLLADSKKQRTSLILVLIVVIVLGIGAIKGLTQSLAEAFRKQTLHQAFNLLWIKQIVHCKVIKVFQVTTTRLHMETQLL